MNTLFQNLDALGQKYGIDPGLLLTLYMMKVIFFWLLFLTALRSLRKREYPAAFSLGALSVVIAVSPYTYLLFAGKNFPAWFIVAIIALILLCIIGIVWKFSKRRCN